MPTHKILCDLDVGGEVKGTSLDINGAGDVSGTLTASSGIELVGNLNAPDNSRIRLGSGADLQIYHDASNSLISQQGTGDLYIENTVDDGDVVFRSDDGSGGNAEYFRLDGGVGYMIASKAIRALDSVNLQLGTSADLTLQHDGTNSKIDHYTGDLYIRNFADDKDIYFQSDDGSGGLTTYMWMDGSAANGTNTYTRMDDNSMMGWGTSFDMYMYHNGTNSYLTNATGDLYIGNLADDKDIIFQSDDGSGGVETYFYLDGSMNTDGTPKTVFPDNSKLQFGSGAADLRLYHDGSNSFIDNSTGIFRITQSVVDGDLVLRADNGSGSPTPYITLDGSAGTVEIAKTTNFASDVTIVNSIIHAGDSDTYFGFHDNDQWRVVTGGTERFEVTDSTTTVQNALTVVGNLTANGNIIGDDSTSITNISSIGADSYGADADSTTRFTMGATSIDCLVADTDVFQVSETDFTFDPAVKVSIHKRNLAKTTATDADADGDIVYFGGTTSMDAGKIYYFTSSGTWALADADAESTAKGMLGVALGAASDTNGMLIRGMVTLDTDPGTIGDTLFLSTTAGVATSTAPSGNGDIVRVIGYCLDSTNGQIYFNPDGTFVEVSA